MEIILFNTDDLIPYEKNPRNNDASVAAVAESIKQFGFKVPVVVDKNSVIVTGHTRYKAAKRLGISKIPCIMANDLTEEQIRAFRIADNKAGEKSSWDMELLEEELEKITNIDMSDFGFEVDEDESWQQDPEEYEVIIPKKPKAKQGDIYKLGNHRLMCGDSTKEEDVKKLVEDKIIDICFTSPPYNAGRTPTELSQGKKSKYEGNKDNKTQEEYKEFVNAFLQIAINVSKYVFMNIQSIANNKLAIIDILHDNKKIYADTIIWDKEYGQPAMGRNVLNSVFEYVHIFSKKGSRSIGTIEFRGTIDNIVHIPPQRKNDYSYIHNATYSVEFAEWFISKFAKKSVYEPFGGTGTDLIVCEKLKKQCYCMEIDPGYVDVIIDRWEKYTGEKAILLK